MSKKKKKLNRKKSKHNLITNILYTSHWIYIDGILSQMGRERATLDCALNVQRQDVSEAIWKRKKNMNVYNNNQINSIKLIYSIETVFGNN